MAGTNQAATSSALQGQSERLALARQLFREFHTRCFWHSPSDLVITEELIPFVARGLRLHGGRRGFLLAARLQASEANPSASQPEPAGPGGGPCCAG